MLKFRSVRIQFILFLLAGVIACRAQDSFKGAGHVIDVLTGKTVDKSSLNPVEAMAAELEEFKKRSASLEPKEAAAEWMELVDRYFELKPLGERRFDSLSLRQVVAVIPHPDSWPEVRRLISLRGPREGKHYGREMGLLLLAHTLMNDLDARNEVLKQLESFFKTNQNKALGRITHSARPLFTHLNGRPKRRGPSFFEFTLEKAEKNQDERHVITVPDLVTRVGEKAAAASLKRVYATTANIDYKDPGATLALARKVVRDNIEAVAVPPWRLVNSPEEMALYEALDKKWPREASKPIGYYREQADAYYQIGLIHAGRTADAIKLESEIGPLATVKISSYLGRDRQPGPLYRHLRGRLEEKPHYPYWGWCFNLAIAAGESAAMIELAEKELTTGSLPAARKWKIRSHLWRAFLAADRVEEAAETLRWLLANPSAADEGKDPVAAIEAEESDRYSGGDSSPVALARDFARLGLLAGNADWTSQGLDRMVSEIRKLERGNYRISSYLLDAFELLRQAKRGPQAEALIVDALIKEKKSQEPFVWGFESLPGNRVLSALALVYLQSGRYADVVQLFDEAPNWQMADIRDQIAAEKNYHPGQILTPYLLARALAETGNLVAARHIAREFLHARPKHDQFYQLLIEIEGHGLLPFVDELAALDRFEERPLIWKAQLLRQAGRLDEAEQAAKAAIALDPFDADQNPGDRMRVYEVYADILRDRGAREQEQSMRGRVRAARFAEEADDHQRLGLHERAVRKYRQALSLFSNSYCMHSWMAAPLRELGRYEEAEKHHQRAFELMAEHFGRAETQCVACRRAFQDPRARSIAERVFERLAKERPDQARVHYLLGYLRQVQARYADALNSYRRATELDGDFLYAWKGIVQLERMIPMSQEEKEKTSLNLLRLDPRGRHEHSRYQRVQNLAVLWKAVHAARRFRRDVPESIYVLKAAAAEMEKTGYGRGDRRDEIMPGWDTPGGAVAYHYAVRLILQFTEPTNSVSF